MPKKKKNPLNQDPLIKTAQMIVKKIGGVMDSSSIISSKAACIIGGVDHEVVLFSPTFSSVILDPETVAHDSHYAVTMYTRQVGVNPGEEKYGWAIARCNSVFDVAKLLIRVAYMGDHITRGGHD
jgi:hypothetical protein